jgi:cytochrome oxidase assembly protein ShyY1
MSTSTGGMLLQWFVMSAAAAAVTLYLMYLARRDSRKAPDHAD